VKVKKTLKLINNERLSIRAKAAKGCDSTSADQCYDNDFAACYIYSTDICTKKDLASCFNHAIDVCAENIDIKPCSPYSQDYYT